MPYTGITFKLVMRYEKHLTGINIRPDILGIWDSDARWHHPLLPAQLRDFRRVGRTELVSMSFVASRRDFPWRFQSGIGDSSWHRPPSSPSRRWTPPSPRLQPRHIRFEGAGSVMDSTGRQIAAEGTVDATTSRPRDAFHIGESWNVRVAIFDRIRNECIHERSIHSRRFRTFLLKVHLPIRLHSMPSAYNICWLIFQHAMHMPPPL